MTTQRPLSIGQALDLGVKYAMEGRCPDAIGLFRAVLMHEPANLEAMIRLGAALFELKQYHEALYWFWRALKAAPQNPLPLTNYGLCLAQLGHPDEGLPFLERALYRAKKKENASVALMALIYNNLGNTFEKLKRYPEALEALDKGLTYKPNDQFSLYNRGIVLLRLNRQLDAIASLNEALAINPNDADARYNRAMGLLLLGRLKDGFEHYEARLIATENEDPNFGLPANMKWRGASIDDIAGRTILVHGEQGLGDHIQFMRFVPRLLEMGATVKMVTHNALHGMIDMPVTILKAGDEIGEFDYWTALMSLPLMLGIKCENEIPAPWVPHFNPWIGRKLLAEGSLKLTSAELNVGVVWAGNWQHKNDENRSIPLKAFSRLFDGPANFISLQQMRPEDTETFAQLKAKHPNLSALWFDDLEKTAAVIDELDLVISADTAVAHLAASMGKPTWILVPDKNTDWRWQLDRLDSPWYPTARLWRQASDSRWEPVIADMSKALADRARRACAA